MKKINIKNNTNELFLNLIIQEKNERNTKRFFTKFGVFFIACLFASIITIFADSNPDANDDENDNIRECQYDQIKCSGKIEAQVFEKSSGLKNVSGGVAAGKDVCNVSGHHADSSSSSGKTINHHVTYSPTSINIGSAGITNISSFCSICDYKANGKALVYEATINCPTEWILGKEYTVSIDISPDVKAALPIPSLTIDEKSFTVTRTLGSYIPLTNSNSWSAKCKILTEGEFSVNSQGSVTWEGATSGWSKDEHKINVKSDLTLSEIAGNKLVIIELENKANVIKSKYSCSFSGGYNTFPIQWNESPEITYTKPKSTATYTFGRKSGFQEKTITATVSDSADITRSSSKSVKVYTHKSEKITLEEVHRSNPQTFRVTKLQQQTNAKYTKISGVKFNLNALSIDWITDLAIGYNSYSAMIIDDFPIIWKDNPENELSKTYEVTYETVHYEILFSKYFFDEYNEKIELEKYTAYDYSTLLTSERWLD